MNKWDKADEISIAYKQVGFSIMGILIDYPRSLGPDDVIFARVDFATHGDNSSLFNLMGVLRNARL